MKTRSVLTALLVLAWLQLVAAGPGLAQGPVSPPDKGVAPQAVPEVYAWPVMEWWYDQLKPAVASGVGDYLVLWEHHDESEGSRSWIYSRLVGGGGLPYGSVLPVAGDIFPEKRRLAPDVAYNAGTGSYLAVWDFEYGAYDHDIHDRLISSDGVPQGETELGLVDPPEYDDRNPAVAANPNNVQYLVVFERNAGTWEFPQRDIYAVRVNGSDGWPLSSVFAVDASANNQRNPAVAYDSVNNQYLVVWEQLVPGSCEGRICYDIMGRLVSANGALGDAISIGQFAGGYTNPASPAVAFNSRAQEFLVVWSDHNYNTDTDWNIMGRRVTAGGAALSLVILAGNADTNNRLSPSVAYDAAANEYLVAYEFAYTSNDHDVHYRRVAPNGLPRDSEAGVSWGGAWESTPDVASRGVGAYLVVWEDARNDVAPNFLDFDIYGAAVRVPAPVYLPLVIKGG